MYIVVLIYNIYSCICFINLSVTAAYWKLTWT